MTVRTFADDISKDDGRFKRTASAFRDKISSAPGSVFTPEKGRYHLYVSLACPWATRTLLVKAIKGIDDSVIGWSKVHWLLNREQGGWFFSPEEGYVDNLHPDTKLLRELYLKSNPQYDGKITTPVLWDEKTQQIVNNESAEIIAMLNTEFNEWAKHPEIDLYPEALRQVIDEINDFIYEGLNNGVYRAGFAQSQKAYEEACEDVFRCLDRLEQMLASRRYLASDTDITFADVRAFVTLIRFDAVYHGHFKCNKQRIKDMPNLWAYLRDLYQRPEFSGVTDFHDIKWHYYGSHKHINPFGIVPLGPDLSELATPHGRDKKIETAQEDLG